MPTVEQPQYPPDAYLISKVYKPWSLPDAPQSEFHSSSAKYRLQVGSYGSGKSRPLLWEGIFHAIEFPGSDNTIVRKTMPDLKRTVIDKFETDVPRELYDSFNKTENIVYFHPVIRRRIEVDLVNGGSRWQKTSDATQCFVLSGGKDCFAQDLPEQQHCPYCADFQRVRSTYRFGACETDKDIGKFLSTEYLYIAFEELGEFPFSIWDAFAGRNRCTIPGCRPCMAGATNPMGIGWGWIKKVFVDHIPAHGMDAKKFNPADYAYFHSTVDQNPIYRNDREYLETLEKSPNAARIRWGKLDAVSGNYFDNFHPDIHVRDADYFVFQTWQPVWIGWDYGFGHYATITFWTKAIRKPRWEGDKPKVVNVCIRELIMQRTTPEDQTKALIAAIPRSVDDRGIDRGFAWNIESIHFSWERFNATVSNRTVADEVNEILQNAGLPIVQRSNTDRIAGWTKMYSLFDTEDMYLLKSDGQHRGCPVLAESIPLVVRGDGIKVSIEDVVKPPGISLEDDICDSARYAVAGTLLDEGDKPKEVKLKEELDKIDDPFRRHMEGYRQFLKETRGSTIEDRPPRYVPAYLRRLQ